MFYSHVIDDAPEAKVGKFRRWTADGTLLPLSLPGRPDGWHYLSACVSSTGRRS